MLKSFIEEESDEVFFYRDSLRRFLVVALVLLVIDYAIIAGLFYRLLSVEQPPYFATTSDGRIIKIEPN